MSVLRNSNQDLAATAAFVQAKRLDLSATTPVPALTEWIRKVRPQTQFSFGLDPALPTELERALQMILQNIVKNPSAPYLALSKSWADYPAASRYNRHPLPLSAVIAATEFLASQGWIVIHPGSKQSGLCTRLEITPSLLATLEREELLYLKLPTPKTDELLLLRDDTKNIVDYEDTKKTTTARRNLHHINAFLRLHQVMHAGHRLHTDLVRIFKNNFTEGGRFYRADHIGLNGEERREITINGEATCEIDFSCLHVNMLYIQETGRPYGGDAYDTGRNDIPRDVFKVLLQIILNCKSEFAATLAANEALRSRGFHTDAEKALAVFLKKHAAIRKHFFSGAGLRLQFQDSEIAERVLLRAMRDQVPVLPVHDSFIAPASESAWLQEAMTEASLEVLGAALPFKQKNAARKAA